jgi:hypothetical protein
MALMVTHLDYLDTESRKSLYRNFLKSVRDERSYWHALPRDVTRWWRRREDSIIESGADGTRRVPGPAAEQAVIAKVSWNDQGLSIRPADGCHPLIRVATQ